MSRLTLIEAVKHRDITLVKALIAQKCDVNMRDTSNLTSLYMAVATNQPECAKLLLEANALTSACDFNNWTILHHAVSDGYLDIVKLLIEHNVNIDEPTQQGSTALGIAATYDRLDCMQYLINAGAQIDVPQNSVYVYAYSPLEFAITNGRSNCTELLLDAGAKVNNHLGSKWCRKWQCPDWVEALITKRENVKRSCTVFCGILRRRFVVPRAPTTNNGAIPKDIVVLLSSYMWRTRFFEEWDYQSK